MTDGEWMEVAREFLEPLRVEYASVLDYDLDFAQVNTLLARAMEMVAQDTRNAIMAGILSAFKHRFAPDKISAVTDAEIISGLMARLKSEKGT